MIRSTWLLHSPESGLLSPRLRRRRVPAAGHLRPAASNAHNSRNPFFAICLASSLRRFPPRMDPPDDPDGYVHSLRSDHPSSDMEEARGMDLPEELARGVVHLECESSAEGGRCDVYLVGTAHVSQQSCREVQAVISYLKPQAVFLELCASRVTILTPQNLQVPTLSEMIEMWKKEKMNTFEIVYGWFLAKVADKLEVFPGSEFRVAFEEARSYGAKVFLGDRPVHSSIHWDALKFSVLLKSADYDLMEITLRRSWGKMTLWHKAKFLYYMLLQAMSLPSSDDLNEMLKEMDDVDILTLVIQEISKNFPTLMETLLHERDLYMSFTLLNTARKHSSVVAVVGKGHLPGIKKNWKQPVEVRHLLEIPVRGSNMSIMKILASVWLAVSGAAIFSTLHFFSKREMVNGGVRSKDAVQVVESLEHEIKLLGKI